MIGSQAAFHASSQLVLTLRSKNGVNLHFIGEEAPFKVTQLVSKWLSLASGLEEFWRLEPCGNRRISLDSESSYITVKKSHRIILIDKTRRHGAQGAPKMNYFQVCAPISGR